MIGTSKVIPVQRNAVVLGQSRVPVRDRKTSQVDLVLLSAEEGWLPLASCMDIVEKWGPLVGVSAPPRDERPNGDARGFVHRAWRTLATTILNQLEPDTGIAAWPLPNLQINTILGTTAKTMIATGTRSLGPKPLLLCDRAQDDPGRRYWIGVLSSSKPDDSQSIEAVMEVYACLDLLPPALLARQYLENREQRSTERRAQGTAHDEWLTTQAKMSILEAGILLGVLDERGGMAPQIIIPEWVWGILNADEQGFLLEAGALKEPD